MAKRKILKNRKGNKIIVKRKFYNAMQILRHLKPKEQRLRTKKASKEFIQDISNVMAKLRKKPHLVSHHHKKTILKYKKPLQRLVKKSSSLKSKRNVLLQRGGIIPFLIPIICASIGAAGTIGASAVGAAIMKS